MVEEYLAGQPIQAPEKPLIDLLLRKQLQLISLTNTKP